MFKKLILVVFLVLLAMLVQAVDWTPYGDINLQDYYKIYNVVNITTGSLVSIGTINISNITLADNCADGQILKWSGGFGVCGDDNVSDPAAWKLLNFTSAYDARTDRWQTANETKFTRENVTEYLGGAGVNASLIKVGNLSNIFEAAWKMINFTGAYDARTDRWQTANETKYTNENFTSNYGTEYGLTGWSWINNDSLVLDNNTIARLNTSNVGNLNMSLYNITDINTLKLSPTLEISHSISEIFSGLEHATALYDTEDHTAGVISHAFLEGDSKILRTWQTGLPDAAGFMRQSQIISAQFGITNATKLSRCSDMAKQQGIDLDGVGCNTTSLGASLFVEGSIRLGHKLAIGGGNKTSYGIISQGFADFNMEGSNFNIFNGSLHPFTPRIEEIGIATGGLVTMIDEDFEDDSISPFQKREQIGIDADNWNIDMDPDFCFDGICARARGGNSRHPRLMEHNVSTIDRNQLNISFWIGAKAIDSIDNLSVQVIDGANSVMVYNFTGTSAGSNTDITPPELVTALIPSSFDNKGKISIRFNMSADNGGTGGNREEFWVDNVIMVGTATASTRQNVTRRDTFILLGDGNQRIFWNDSSKILELPPNVTIISETIQDLIVSGTFTLGDRLISSFDEIIASSWVLSNFTEAYDNRGDRWGTANETKFTNENFTTRYDLRTDRWQIANSSAQGYLTNNSDANISNLLILNPPVETSDGFYMTYTNGTTSIGRRAMRVTGENVTGFYNFTDKIEGNVILQDGNQVNDSIILDTTAVGGEASGTIGNIAIDSGIHDDEYLDINTLYSNFKLENVSNNTLTLGDNVSITTYTDFLNKTQQDWIEANYVTGAHTTDTVIQNCSGINSCANVVYGNNNTALEKGNVTDNNQIANSAGYITSGAFSNFQYANITQFLGVPNSSIMTINNLSSSGGVINHSIDLSGYWGADGDISADEISESKINFITACASGNHYYLNGNDLACEADDDTTYTADETNLTLDGTVFRLLQVDLAELDNSVSAFITNAVSDLVNYFTKSEIFTHINNNITSNNASMNIYVDGTFVPLTGGNLTGHYNHTQGNISHATFVTDCYGPNCEGQISYNGSSLVLKVT